MSQATVPLRLLQALPPALIAREALAPLRYAAHRDAGELGALGAEAPRLKRLYLGTLAENTVRLRRLAELLDATTDAGVVLMPFKGALLAETLYPDPGTRPMADLDLLVRGSDLGRAEAVLAELGFRRMWPDARRYRPPFAHDLTLFDGRQVLELHFRWVHGLGVRAEVEPLFARAIELPLLGRTRWVPSWEDHLMIAAVHAASHCFDQPGWLVDVALLAERAGGFAEAAARARTARAERAFATAVMLATQALGSWAPPPQTSARGWRRARWLAPLLTSTFARPPSRWASLAARLLMADRVGDAAAMVATRTLVVLDERWRARRGAAPATAS